MDLKDLEEYCQIKALSDKLQLTEDAVWRSYCRSYSKLFHTPLHIVEELDPEKVMLAVHEDNLDDVDVEDRIETILDIIYSIEDPEYAKSKRDEFKQFIKDAEEEEEERQVTGKPIHKSLANEDEVSLKNTPKKASDTKNEMPQSGGINLAYLEQEEINKNTGEDF